jgi:hypothetical protein
MWGDSLPDNIRMKENRDKNDIQDFGQEIFIISYK